MLINKNTYGHKSRKKHITGKGFVDSLSTMFNAIRPALKDVGSYISQNKDLIAKPVLGALGSLAATGISAGVPAILSHIANRNNKSAIAPKAESVQLDAKGREILNSIILAERTPQTYTPVTNIIGSGMKRKTRGGGIKQF
jgi:hypothetical protein